MRGFGRIILLASVLLTALLLSPSPASACDFPDPPPPREALDGASAVFTGEVVSIDPAPDDPSDQYLAVTFDVDRVWKGVESSPVIVETHSDGAACGFPFEEDREYLVYASSEGTPLVTAMYHRTRAINQADEDLAALGEGTEVAVQTETDATDDDDEFNLGILLLVVVIGSIILATVMLLRQSRPGLPENYDDIEAGEDDPAGDR